jgi:UDP-2-acetamido-3-amino-2,3-dideoxy-glucuronate N-acetyltransferase
LKSAYFVHPSSIVERTAKIGKDTEIWHFCHIMENVKIGKNCKLGQNVYVGSDVIIGNNVKIQNNVSIYSGVILEDDVFCGPSMVFTNVLNPRSAYPRHKPDGYIKTRVKQGATIGANATVICGVTLGKYSFVGAGSVVTKDIADYALAYGNPARLKGWICECAEKIKFQGNRAICGVCKRIFNKNGLKVIQIKAKKDGAKYVK